MLEKTDGCSSSEDHGAHNETRLWTIKISPRCLEAYTAILFLKPEFGNEKFVYLFLEHSSGSKIAFH